MEDDGFEDALAAAYEAWQAGELDVLDGPCSAVDGEIPLSRSTNYQDGMHQELQTST